MNRHPGRFEQESLAHRVALARQRYFSDGLVPSGIVSDAVLQSWSRCHDARHDPRDEVGFEPVTHSGIDIALQRNSPLLRAWSGELAQMQAALASTSCAAMLTDASGILIGATCVGRAHEALMPVATRLGVDLSEEAVGTTAPGIVAKTGKQVSVLGGEHYFEEVRAMQCAAAPIRDTSGRLAGVLDLSSECMPFAFDPAAVVGLYAAAIENRMLVDASRELLVLMFQVGAALIDSPMAGLIGIDGHGDIVWANAVARRLAGLGERAIAIPLASAEEVFGLNLPALLALPRAGAMPLQLASGLTVWARAELRAPDGRSNLFVLDPARRVMRDPAPVATPVASAVPDDHVAPFAAMPASCSLRAADQDLIARTLRACDGNVARAARELGVSRGLVYRRLRDGATAPAAPLAVPLAPDGRSPLC